MHKRSVLILAGLGLSACGPVAASPAPAPAPSPAILPPSSPGCTPLIDLQGVPFVSAQHLALAYWPPGVEQRQAQEGVIDPVLTGAPGPVLGAALDASALWVLVGEEFSDGQGLHNGGLLRLPLDGGAPEPRLTGRAPTAFASDERGLLFAEGPAVYRQDFDAPAPVLVVDGLSALAPADGQPTVVGLALDANWTYVEFFLDSGMRLVAFPRAGGAPQVARSSAAPMEALTVVPGGLAWLERGQARDSVFVWKAGSPAPSVLFEEPQVSMLTALGDEVFALAERGTDAFGDPDPSSAALEAVSVRGGSRRRLEALSAQALQSPVLLSAVGGRLLLGEAQCDPTLHVLDPATGRVLADANVPGLGAVLSGRDTALATVAPSGDERFRLESRFIASGLPTGSP